MPNAPYSNSYMKRKHKYIYLILVICFAGIALFLTFNRHSKSGYFNYHSEIWADKGGYYVYLPAAFKFKFNPDNFPDSIDDKTGHGFTLDYENKKVLTKYTYGVALLQLPFFLMADTFAETLNYKANGFSPNNGLFLYSPFYFVIIASLIYMIRKGIKNGVFILVLFLVISYVFSSWWDWDAFFKLVVLPTK